MGERTRKPWLWIIGLAVLAVAGVLVVPRLMPQAPEEVVEVPPSKPTGSGRPARSSGHGKRLPSPKACLSAATVEGLEGG